PFEADTSSSTALARLHNDPPRPRLIKPGVPRELEAITMRLLARNPDDRFPTATDVRAALLSAGADDRAPTTDEVTAAAPVPPTVGTPAARPAPDSPGTWHTPPGGSSPPRFADSERRWLIPALLVVLVAVALGGAGLLLQGSGPGLLGGPPAGAPADAPAETTVERATPLGTLALDPQGDGSEHPDEARNGYAFDGDPSTSWSSERYNTPEWGGLKDGVGLILELDEPGPVRGLEIDTGVSGWHA